MLTLIEGGRVYDPDPRGVQSVLLADGHVSKVGDVNRSALERLGTEYQIINARGCIVAPGLIDPHNHLLGGSGETGFSTQTPEFFISEIVRFGITTVVGTLGVDTTMKTMAGLLAKVKALREQKLNAYCWTGGYDVPPNSILASVREDIMFIDEVIGAGEVAISDERALAPDPRELARTVTHAHIGGMLARKAGLMHVHVGDRDRRLAPIREVLENFDVEPDWFYLTHVERTEKLIREAAALAQKGMPCDVDVVERELYRYLRWWKSHGGPPELLTCSSDASMTSPRNVWEQMRDCVREHGHPLEEILPLATRNTARILKLKKKGELRRGCVGDVLLIDEATLDIVHVLSRGTWMVRDGEVVEQENWLRDSDREIRLHGTKDEEDESEPGGSSEEEAYQNEES
ncbi:amidohydrolase family protein [Longimicrobium terrae]|uniref:Beta-aspartyl-dipeptidase (Metallo-type) n=1 Tax=Longimicrobium terrae TaxID=1639882 RepID=A0A841H6N1_9BACT|nr:amidohydrolase family protein [Longimicrobium terrae]MBB4638203.1 beta-aspartyl-dipeptidase (metallo-type) [Longimicrobium terrae]MBB6073638.1 beta-aspartyl-dipeptidase (metallo-type) [Longimicrobium terrae]NNC30317.1 beta-aspartyl-peptidase [Longimicrobium terrae]